MTLHYAIVNQWYNIEGDNGWCSEVKQQINSFLTILTTVK